ncbi:hypothetical protein B4U80_03251 [Leptotrombidium deliense]|uniref:Uncharacterized protein n=1 Tax=Leptotrombidium deliense TaxID=299467 RepID=A0A443SWB3_9ACAR|nr:hypothetical protein B4U80_03251 [Leptotrombidium deliense]
MSDKNENRSSATSDECAVKCVSSKKSRKGNSKKRKANSGQKMQKANCDTIKDQFYRSVAPKDMKSKQKVTKKCDDECGSSSKRFNSDDETSGASEECESREVCEDLRQTPDAHTGFKSNKCDDSNNSAQKKKFKVCFIHALQDRQSINRTR